MFKNNLDKKINENHMNENHDIILLTEIKTTYQLQMIS